MPMSRLDNQSELSIDKLEQLRSSFSFINQRKKRDIDSVFVSSLKKINSLNNVHDILRIYRHALIMQIDFDSRKLNRLIKDEVNETKLENS